MNYSWSRNGPGYEISSLGDSRYSAFNAVMYDGRTIEQHYQCDVKGYNKGGTNWRLGKGKPALDPTKDLYSEYLLLWCQWALDNQHLVEELISIVEEYNYTLTDKFATSEVNQAHALADVLEMYTNLKSSGDEQGILDIF